MSKQLLNFLTSNSKIQRLMRFVPYVRFSAKEELFEWKSKMLYLITVGLLLLATVAAIPAIYYFWSSNDFIEVGIIAVVYLMLITAAFLPNLSAPGKVISYAFAFAVIGVSAILLEHAHTGYICFFIIPFIAGLFFERTGVIVATLVNLVLLLVIGLLFWLEVVTPKMLAGEKFSLLRYLYDMLVYGALSVLLGVWVTFMVHWLRTTMQRISQQHAEMRYALQRATEASKLKSSFLLNISHEIRTPMNALTGFAQLIKLPDLDHRKRMEYCDLMAQSSMRLLTTLEDIMEISKIAAKQVVIRDNQFNVPMLLTECATSIRRTLHNSGKPINVIVDAVGSDLQLTTDQERVKSILMKLLHNAVKFTERGEIHLGAEFQIEENCPVVCFYVSDTGQGIAPDMYEYIFQQFAQENRSGFTEGAGLGLSIAESYVKLMGGRIWLNSEVDKGTTFYFTVPDKLS